MDVGLGRRAVIVTGRIDPAQFDNIFPPSARRIGANEYGNVRERRLTGAFVILLREAWRDEIIKPRSAGLRIGDSRRAIRRDGDGDGHLRYDGTCRHSPSCPTT